jgi:hypothetical protein
MLISFTSIIYDVTPLNSSIGAYVILLELLLHMASTLYPSSCLVLEKGELGFRFPSNNKLIILLLVVFYMALPNLY